MADLKKEIDDRIMLIPRMGQIVDGSKRNSISIKTNSVKSDTSYELEECIVSIRTKKDVQDRIHVKSVIRSILELEGTIALPHIRKVIINGVDRIDDKSVDVRFLIVHNFQNELSVE